MDKTISPEIMRLSNPADREKYMNYKNADSGVLVFDTIHSQLRELLKTRNPEKSLDEATIERLMQTHLAGQSAEEYGVWVFYPWTKRMVHILDEEEFVFLRTNRNCYKITPEEQKILALKKIGIIGLSVGQSVALTLAMERGFGELRLADFDTLDLSNLNRLRAGLHQIGLSKTIICAREIAETDPFLKVKLFNEGIDENNIDAFFNEGGMLDLLIEECDGLDIKILSRYKAKHYRVPVLMDTSDRGMLDIERFDLEPDRDIIHGLVGEIDVSKLKDLNMEERIEILLPMVGLNSLSERVKASMIEVSNSISSWPQLASAVVMGGGATAEMSRKILLGQCTVSGRFYIDLDEIISEPIQNVTQNNDANLFEKELSLDTIKSLSKQLNLNPSKFQLRESEQQLIAEAAIMAPSGGNTQPWKLYFEKGHLILFHDIYFSHSLLDFNNIGSYIGFGAMIENINIQTNALGYQTQIKLFPLKKQPKIVAVISFTSSNSVPDLSGLIHGMKIRYTNRNYGVREQLPVQFFEDLQMVVKHFDPIKLHFITDPDKMDLMGDILASGEKLVLMHPEGHDDIFNKELRFTKEEVLRTRDGLDVGTLNITKGEILALKIASSRKTIEWIDKIGGGEAFKKMTKKAVASSSALGIITIPGYNAEHYVNGGSAMERVWIECNKQGISFQPVSQLLFLFARLNHGKGEGYNEDYILKLKELSIRFKQVLPLINGEEAIFIFRLGHAKEMAIKSLRRPLDKILMK
ncbi:MAG: Rv1355c family protein [Bacteroidota bacterium]|nr:Rv1355c family protein [Bacteroidota bacterium]